MACNVVLQIPTVLNDVWIYAVSKDVANSYKMPGLVLPQVCQHLSKHCSSACLCTEKRGAGSSCSCPLFSSYLFIYTSMLILANTPAFTLAQPPSGIWDPMWIQVMFMFGQKSDFRTHVSRS